MKKFTHPKDAPEGHKWTYRGVPVLEIFEGPRDLLVVYDDGTGPHSVRVDEFGKIGATQRVQRVFDAPREHTVWFNVYRMHGGDGYTSYAYETREIADKRARSGRIHCFKHTFTEGEGL